MCGGWVRLALTRTSTFVVLAGVCVCLASILVWLGRVAYLLRAQMAILLSVCLLRCLSVCLPVCLSVCPYVCLSDFVPVRAHILQLPGKTHDFFRTACACFMLWISMRIRSPSRFFVSHRAPTICL
ncbi:unnamed protein product [Pylaiella littoralis]